MNVEHIAIWAKDIERLRQFYETYFEASSNAKYTNLEKGFSSYRNYGVKQHIQF
jgi:lactoylglutathione lyase